MAWHRGTGCSRLVWRIFPAGIRELEVGNQAPSCQPLLPSMPRKGCVCLVCFLKAGRLRSSGVGKALGTGLGLGGGGVLSGRLGAQLWGPHGAVQGSWRLSTEPPDRGGALLRLSPLLTARVSTVTSSFFMKGNKSPRQKLSNRLKVKKQISLHFQSHPQEIIPRVSCSRERVFFKGGRFTLPPLLCPLAQLPMAGAKRFWHLPVLGCVREL